MAWRLSKYAKAKILSIEYRLAPQYQFPAALQDMLSGYLYLIDPPQGQRKYSPSQVIFAGDSAGGNLSIAAVYWLKQNSYPAPGGIVGLSPWLDLSHSLPSVLINDVYDYLPHQSKDPRYIHEDRFHYLLPDNENFHDALVSPLFGNSEQLQGLPPTLLQVGDAEKLRDESILFSLLALKEGNQNVHVELYEDMVHVFHMVICIFKYLVLSERHSSQSGLETGRCIYMFFRQRLYRCFR
jgi:acetyl esterase/lipase